VCCLPKPAMRLQKNVKTLFLPKKLNSTDPTKVRNNFYFWFLLPDIFEVFFSSDPIGIGQLLEGPHILKTNYSFYNTYNIYGNATYDFYKKMG
jgi:hypothetical protein